MSKKIVVPGELVTEERKRLGQNVYIREGKIYSNCVGIVKDEDDGEARVVPLKGTYDPRDGDVVIGIIKDEKFSVYEVELNYYQTAFIKKLDLRDLAKPGTVISAKVFGVNEVGELDIGYPKTFYGGEIIEIPAVKVPRIIGRNGSMLEVLKKRTNCNLVVGKNGWIWAKGDNLELLKEAIKKIDDEAHLDNLTDRMDEFLEKKKGKVK